MVQVLRTPRPHETQKKLQAFGSFQKGNHFPFEREPADGKSLLHSIKSIFQIKVNKSLNSLFKIYLFIQLYI